VHRRWGADDSREMFAGAHLAVADLFPHVNVPGSQKREHNRTARISVDAARMQSLDTCSQVRAVAHPSRPHPWMGGQMYTMMGRKRAVGSPRSRSDRCVCWCGSTKSSSHE